MYIFLFQIAKMFSLHNVTFDFTALEMKDSLQPSNCLCAPEELVQQTQKSAQLFNTGPSPDADFCFVCVSFVVT